MDIPYQVSAYIWNVYIGRVGVTIVSYFVTKLRNILLLSNITSYMPGN